MTAAADESATPALPRRLWPALALLGFASGLPQPLVDSTFSTWLAKAGYARGELVLLGYVTLPFALKPLWAPLVDRFVPPVLGRRRGWLLACQLAVLLALGVMALSEPRAQLGWMLAAATLVAFAAATQDLVVNGYTCDALPPERLAAGAGLSVWGYRGAWLVSGGFALIAAERWGFGAAYAAMAVLLVPGMLGTLLAPEPRRVLAPTTLRAALLVPLQEWRASLGARGLGLLLLFVLLYKLPDGLANLLAVPFLSTHYDLGALGLWRGVIGLGGAAAGVGLAAWATPRLGMLRALFLFGLLQALSNLGYVGIEQRWWQGLAGLIGVLFVENLCGALAAAVFVAYLMSFCRSASSATQYALLSAVTLLGPHLLRQPLAQVSARLGWSGFFVLTALAVLPGLALIFRLRPASPTPVAPALPKKGA